MRRRNAKGRPSKAACDVYRRLMADDFSRLEKGGINLDELLTTDLDLPEVDLTHETGEDSGQ